jgi:hypothetical protein
MHGSKFEVKAKDSIREFIYVPYSLSLSEKKNKNYYDLCKIIVSMGKRRFYFVLASVVIVFLL